jgi:hypothetical protein
MRTPADFLIMKELDEKEEDIAIIRKKSGRGQGYPYILFQGPGA